MPTDPDGIVTLAGNVEVSDAKPDIPDAYALLDELVMRQIITKQDKKIVTATVIEGKSLRDLATARQYEQVKKCRQPVSALSRHRRRVRRTNLPC